MKKIKYTIILLSLLALVSCADEATKGISRTTYFPIFEITGDEEVFSKVGMAYVDPGVVATEAGKPIEVQTTFIGNYFGISGSSLNTNEADKYSVEYAAVNVDGFRVTAARTVYLVGQGDFVSGVEGLYKCSVARNGSNPVTAQNIKYIIIKKTGTNTYAISDAIGGWYEFHRGFGIGYSAQGGTFTVNDIATNNVTFNSPAVVGGFGGNATMIGMTFDVVNKKIVVTAAWDPGTPYTFVSTLTQVTL